MRGKNEPQLQRKDVRGDGEELGGMLGRLFPLFGVRKVILPQKNVRLQFTPSVMRGK